MCVAPVLPGTFGSSKIELDKINKHDLSNYDSLKQLAKKRFCDILIEKKDDIRSVPDYNIYRIIARRKWINPQYVFGDNMVTVLKNTPKEDVAKQIYEATIKAMDIAKEKTLELAKRYIGK